jgi:hypothetical protein
VHVRTDGPILALDVGRGNVARIVVASNNLRSSAGDLRWAVAHGRARIRGSLPAVVLRDRCVVHVDARRRCRPRRDTSAIRRS